MLLLPCVLKIFVCHACVNIHVPWLFVALKRNKTSNLWQAQTEIQEEIRNLFASSRLVLWRRNSVPRSPIWFNSSTSVVLLMNLATRIVLRVVEQLVPSANDGESDLIGFVV